MTDSEALQHVHVALEKTLEKAVTVTPETELFAEKILDSLDTMLFFLSLEELSGVHFPDEELEAAGLSNVGNIIRYMTKA